MGDMSMEEASEFPDSMMEIGVGEARLTNAVRNG
jgi:hypothetical protein